MVPRSSAVGASNVFPYLLVLRVVNSLSIKTFFQPDEYFQALEPAWHLAFGDGSGAWLTWEWENQLRSSLHPTLFAVVYRSAALCADWFHLSIAARSNLLLIAPKLTQAVFATLTDYCTFRCAQKIYGPRSPPAWAALALSILSPWHAFCSTRTFSNSIETALTAAALAFCPWSIFPPTAAPSSTLLIPSATKYDLRLCLLLAAFATILRPTNVLIWIALVLPLLASTPKVIGRLLVTESIFCGSLAFLVSLLADWWYYGFFTVPLWRFLHFNIAQDLASFYGKNRLDYYFTEGLPLLLTTALPFTIVGAYQALTKHHQSPSLHDAALSGFVLTRLAWVILFVILAFSLISHKEVRFLFPLLPALHLHACQPLGRFFSGKGRNKLIVGMVILLVNAAIIIYTTQTHQRGVIDVVHYLRQEHEQKMARHGDVVASSVAFLMPCHSTPFRSHLIHPGISAWALTCNPPLEIPRDARADYQDEADKFYQSPKEWISHTMQPLTSKGNCPSGSRATASKAPWPDYLVFFEQLGPVMEDVLNGTAYHECWRTFNTHWHDDHRRRGDVLVWCR